MMDRMTQDEGRSALPDALWAARVVILLPATSLEDALAPIRGAHRGEIGVVSLPPPATPHPSRWLLLGPRLPSGCMICGTPSRPAGRLRRGSVRVVARARRWLVLSAGGVPNLVSALTPTEVANVWHSGVAAVQVVPAMILGNAYPAQLVALVPDARLVARGPESSFEIKAWLGAGAVAVCVGPKLWGDALEGGDLGALRLRARTVVEAAAPPKQ